jgi:hypothetical protein
MRLKTKLAVGILAVSGMALSLPAKPTDATGDEGATAKKPGKISQLFMFHKSPKKDQPSKTTSTSEVKKHTNGFPEADKKSPEYQPQNGKHSPVDDMFKTTENRDTFKKVDSN